MTMIKTAIEIPFFYSSVPLEVSCLKTTVGCRRARSPDSLRIPFFCSTPVLLSVYHHHGLLCQSVFYAQGNFGGTACWLLILGSRSFVQRRSFAHNRDSAFPFRLFICSSLSVVPMHFSVRCAPITA